MPPRKLTPAAYGALQSAFAELQDLEKAAKAAGLSRRAAEKLFDEGLPALGLAPIGTLWKANVAAALKQERESRPADSVLKNYQPLTKWLDRKIANALRPDPKTGNSLYDELAFEKPMDFLNAFEKTVKIKSFVHGEVEGRVEVVETTAGEHAAKLAAARQLAREEGVSEEEALALLEESLAGAGNHPTRRG